MTAGTLTHKAQATRETLAWLPGVAERLGYYVYALRDPRDGAIFYAGKGHGDRAYAHARYARRVDPRARRGQLRLDRIREVHAAGQEVEVEVIRHGLSEQDAFTVEAAVLDALKLTGAELTNLVAGQGAGEGWQPLDELIATYAARTVEIPPEHQVLLIRLNRRQWTRTEEALYERTRKWWVLGRRRLDAEYAFAIYDGIVRGVWRIDGWEQPSSREIKRDPRRRRRWAFQGKPAANLAEHYRWADVRQYLGADGARNPISYVNC